jgi:iron complex transport system substrate-binding protein
MKKWFLVSVLAFVQFFATPCPAIEQRMLTNAAGQPVVIPQKVTRVICSGPGALRLLSYLECQDRIVAVDDMEKRRSRFDARPYAIANPQFKQYPIFGEFRGHDHPELILTLDPQPQIIFKTFAAMGHDPKKIAQKTQIPVIVLEYGDLGKHRLQLYQSLRTMGRVLGVEKRAEAVIAFFDENVRLLDEKTRNIPAKMRPSCYVGGIALKGPHGFQSTEPGYPPFAFVNADNVAHDPVMMGKSLQYSNVAKEKIVEWDPDVLFLDLSTLQTGDMAGGLHELKTDPAYRSLTGVKKGYVYGVLPYNWYTQNFGSILANAFFIGKRLYPDAFKDIDPGRKADEIYSFLVGKAVFRQMNTAFKKLVFEKIPLD